ncbi:MAG: PHP domain-containing protein [Oscillospiraceae bacterium]|nr:PHP domain-containing protein [Oscillospiraceae bacterium]
MIDLHTHSSCSDGQYTPTELVRRAKACGITHLALTDHDTVDGLAEAHTAAKKEGIRFLCGIEISTDFSHQHILGLGISPDAQVLQDACAAFAERREQRMYKILSILAEQGIVLDADAVRSRAKGQVGRPHIARELIAQGYASSVSEAFQKYLRLPAIRALKDEKPSDKDAIALIHAAGGKAILAHPLELSMTNEQLTERLNILRGMGLDGIEAFYRVNTAEDKAFFCAYAKKYGLLVTGGSDYHGELVKPDVPLGIPTEPAVIAQKELVWS